MTLRQWIIGIFSALSGLFLTLQIPAVQQSITNRLFDHFTRPMQFTVRVHGQHGLFPWQINADEVTLTDADGMFLQFKDSQLHFSLWSLIRGRIEISAWHVKTLHWARIPGIDFSNVNWKKPVFQGYWHNVQVDEFRVGGAIMGTAQDQVASVAGEMHLSFPDFFVDLDYRTPSGSILRANLDWRKAGLPIGHVHLADHGASFLSRVLIPVMLPDLPTIQDMTLDATAAADLFQARGKLGAMKIDAHIGGLDKNWHLRVATDKKLIDGRGTLTYHPDHDPAMEGDFDMALNLADVRGKAMGHFQATLATLCYGLDATYKDLVLRDTMRSQAGHLLLTCLDGKKHTLHLDSKDLGHVTGEATTDRSGETRIALRADALHLKPIIDVVQTGFTGDVTILSHGLTIQEIDIDGRLSPAMSSYKLLQPLLTDTTDVHGTIERTPTGWTWQTPLHLKNNSMEAEIQGSLTHAWNFEQDFSAHIQWNCPHTLIAQGHIRADYSEHQKSWQTDIAWDTPSFYAMTLKGLLRGSDFKVQKGAIDVALAGHPLIKGNIDVDLNQRRTNFTTPHGATTHIAFTWDGQQGVRSLSLTTQDLTIPALQLTARDVHVAFDLHKKADWIQTRIDTLHWHDLALKKLQIAAKAEGQLTAQAQEALWKKAALRDVLLKAQQTPAGWNLDGISKANAGGQSLRFSGQLATTDHPTFHITEITISGQETLRTRDVTFSYRDGILSSTPFTLASDTGQVQLPQGLHIGDAIRTQIIFSKMSLEPLTFLGIVPRSRGIINGQMTLPGAIDLHIAHMRPLRALQSNGVDVRLQGHHDGRGLDLMAHLKATAYQGTMHLIQANKVWTVTGKGNGRLELLTGLLGAAHQSIRGTLAHDITAVLRDGALQSIKGYARLDQGTYENADLGLSLHHITCAIEGHGQTLHLKTLQAQAFTDGSIRGDGHIALSPLRPDLSLTISNVPIDLRQKFTALTRGQIRILSAKNNTLIQGTLTLDKAVYKLGDDSPGAPKFFTIDRLENIADTKSAWQAAMQLNLDLKLAQGLHISGKGLSGLWDGALTVNGTIAAPTLAGKLVAQRAEFDLFGKVFKLDLGNITYDNRDDNDPMLDLRGTRKMPDFEARLKIQGRSESPSVTLDSLPQMTTQDLMAKLLFGSGQTRLSVGQSLQLANAMAALNQRHSLDVLGGLRSAFGLDTLGFKEREDDGREKSKDDLSVSQSAKQDKDIDRSTLTIGKQLSDRVYISVDQGVTPNNRRASIEVAVTPRITVETDVSADRGVGAGVNFRYPY